MDGRGETRLRQIAGRRGEFANQRKGRAPLVSFVVPTYNYGRYLPDCLQSIFDQQGVFDFEVVVVDDASEDDTRSVVRSFADPRLRYFRNQRNLGIGSTLKRGLERCRGRYVARIDADDRYRPCFLQETVGKLVRFPEVGLVYGDVALIDSEGRITLDQSDSVHAGRDFKGNEFISLLSKHFVCSATVIARREAWINALPVPDILTNDDWYLALMVARNHAFYFVARVLAEYRVHGGNLHAAVVRNGAEERSVIWVLNRVFSEVEPNPAIEASKRRGRRAIYAEQYLTLANKYFGEGMYTDARRAYLRSLRSRPTGLFQPATLRRLAGTLMGRRVYEGIKAAVKAAIGRLSAG